MKHRYTLPILLVIICHLMIACQKDKDPKPAAHDAACFIKKETTNDGDYILYQYDKDNNPTKVEKYNPYLMTHVLEIFYDKIALAEVNKLHPMTFTTHYGVGILATLPDVGLVSVTMDNVTQVNWRTYFFHYDYKGRLIRVGEETENIQADDEWELLISYNDGDNVIKMVYQLTTGSRSVSTVVMVDAHDDKPTPYAGVKGYKFLSSNWDSSDPGPIITALSKNNPTSFRLFVNDALSMQVSMQYEYNEHGFPILRTVKHTNEAGEYVYQVNYEYTCP